MSNPIINLQDYTVAEHIFFAIGCLLWVVVYLIILKNIKNKQFIEIPIIAVGANFAWEFLWSWVFRTDMGELYVWGYRAWFFLDCFIVYGLFRYGFKQWSVSWLTKNARIFIAGNLAAWFLMLFFYIQNYDLPNSHMGAYSGYILNVMMSALYIPLLLRMNNISLFSLTAAWAKGVGTFLISIFCFLHFDDWFLLSMCVVTTILDAIYISLFTALNKSKNNVA